MVIFVKDKLYIDGVEYILGIVEIEDIRMQDKLENFQIDFLKFILWNINGGFLFKIIDKCF